MDLRLRTRPSVAPTERATIVEVAGELDLHAAPQLRAEMGRAIESSQAPRIVADLSGVTFIDSTGVGVLVGALKRTREAGGALHFCNAPARVRRVFEITGLIGVLPLFATREEAVDAFEPATKTLDAPENVNRQPGFGGAPLAAGESQ